MLSNKFSMDAIVEDVSNLRRDETIDRERVNCSIGIYHEQVFVECWVNSNNVLNLVIHLQLERAHRRVKVDLEDQVNECVKH